MLPIGPNERPFAGDWHVARRLLTSAVCTVIGTSALTVKSSALQPEALIPLAIVQVQDVPHNNDTGETRHIAVTIKNTGTKLIVAWGLGSEARLANSKVLRSFVTADAYENVGRSLRGTPSPATAALHRTASEQACDISPAS